VERLAVCGGHEAGGGGPQEPVSGVCGQRGRYRGRPLPRAFRQLGRHLRLL
ncbi:hypothetical protein M9458_047268, partial [Cirrhinus mrigala]